MKNRKRTIEVLGIRLVSEGTGLGDVEMFAAPDDWTWSERVHAYRHPSRWRVIASTGSDSIQVSGCGATLDEAVSDLLVHLPLVPSLMAALDARKEAA